MAKKINKRQQIKKKKQTQQQTNNEFKWEYLKPKKKKNK